MINTILLAILAYLLGSIPSGFIIAKAHGIDIRTIGSKSTTSTNVSRVLGWKWGIVSAFFDVLKGIIAVFLAKKYLEPGYDLILVSLLPVIGHIFPIYLKFKGGKGAATFFGSTAVLIGPKFFLSCFLIWIIALMIFKKTSITNLLFVWILAGLLYVKFAFYYFIYGLLGAIIITFALRENIQRLRQGKEPKTKFKW